MQQDNLRLNMEKLCGGRPTPITCCQTAGPESLKVYVTAGLRDNRTPWLKYPVLTKIVSFHDVGLMSFCICMQQWKIVLVKKALRAIDSITWFHGFLDVMLSEQNRRWEEKKNTKNKMQSFANELCRLTNDIRSVSPVISIMQSCPRNTESRETGHGSRHLKSLCHFTHQRDCFSWKTSSDERLNIFKLLQTRRTKIQSLE